MRLFDYVKCFGLFFLLSCSIEKPNVVDNPLPACIEHAKDAEVYGYCVYKNAKRLPDINSVNKYCSQAGKWKEDCRQTWVLENRDGHSLEALMDICAQNADCAFHLLDTKPHPDLLEQTKLCIRYADRYRHDCVMHAIQRWYFEWPDADEISRIANEKSPFPEQIGTFIGARVACVGVGTCDGIPENKSLCEKYVIEYQDKSKCPNQHRKRKPLK